MDNFSSFFFYLAVNFGAKRFNHEVLGPRDDYRLSTIAISVCQLDYRPSKRRFLIGRAKSEGNSPLETSSGKG